MSATIQRDRQIPGLIADSDRDEPTPDVIEGIRARFPTETEYDRMLTRKMERRAGQVIAASIWTFSPRRSRTC